MGGMVQRRSAVHPNNRVAACSICHRGVFATLDIGVWLSGPLLGIAHGECADAAGYTGTPIALEKVTEKPGAGTRHDG